MPADAARRFEVALVGAGVAGCEAAWRCARAGTRVVLITTSLDTVYRPARPRAALEPPAGSLGETLAASLPRGEDGAVDAVALQRAAKYALEATPGLHLLQSDVAELDVDAGRVRGVRTWEGVPFTADAVALTVGSFLRARLRVGDAEEHAGRPGEMAYDDLADDLEAHGFRFEAAGFDLLGDGGHPGYRVRFQRFAEDERQGLRLTRLEGLWAAGVALRGPRAYPDVAAEGMALADQLASVSARGSV